MAKNDLAIYGKDIHHDNLAEYEPSEAYKDQEDTRTIKHLMFTWTVTAPNSMMPDAPDLLKERTAKRGDVVTLEELGLHALEKGERLGSFFTDAELDYFRRGGVTPTEPPAEGADPSELGEHELAEYIENNKPNVADTVALAGDDPEAAKRVLEAERIATKGVPRAGVEQGLASIISRGEQTQ